MIKTPIDKGILQSDLDCAGFDLLNFDGGGTSLPTGGTTGQLLQKQSSTDGDADWATVASGGGSNPLITINVQDAPYNAVGDGVADDTAAIQAALNALVVAGGGTLFFPRGTYLCNGAFDGSTNSILKIPNVAIADPMQSIELLGETYINWGSSGLYDHGTMIKSTKVGTGTEPALLAANPFSGYAMSIYTSFNNIMLRVKNMIFWVTDSSMNALRMDTSADAVIENVTALGAAPSTGTGIWMPNTGNFAVSYANNVNIANFGYGMRIGEHFRCPCAQIAGANIGVSFMEANDPSWANFTMLHAVYFIEFTGLHAVELFLDIEDGPPGPVTINHIRDPSNYGSGLIKYQINQGGSPHTANPINVSGGNKIDLMDLVTGNTQLASTAKLNIGPDLRLVSISGGGKLQARNPGTGTWADVDQWTNP